MVSRPSGPFVAIERLAREQGFRIDRTGTNHVRYTPPDPAKRAVTFSPRNIKRRGGHVWENIVAELRRSGLVLPSSDKEIDMMESASAPPPYPIAATKAYCRDCAVTDKAAGDARGGWRPISEFVKHYRTGNPLPICKACQTKKRLATTHDKHRQTAVSHAPSEPRTSTHSDTQATEKDMYLDLLAGQEQRIADLEEAMRKRVSHPTLSVLLAYATRLESLRAAEAVLAPDQIAALRTYEAECLLAPGQTDVS